ncbi:Centromere/kinetochore protein zw10 homolog [Seminavis robusta]|uniref:Centromere/kinetochore protein zw10 homolog n=1 Tax=Seminavis robusta TaxID=568900 RepID=A0A9N8HCG2_9STRA|nr:Centromere/kinetochore protein zw10 homolog [Seminavis robusta]|eukprot:Sro408_g136860.1 Centromere/kinetochore protein zw10 homolog (901) ;mRNA; f:15546-18248
MASSPDAAKDTSVEGRLSTVRKAVRKATEEALQEVALSTGTTDGTGPQFADPNASFNLGMELFGQPQSVVQKNVREKLDEIEGELQEVKQVVSSRQWKSKTEDQENIAENPANQETKGKTKEELQAEAKLLSKKISFLRQCSLARSLLDESMALSKPGLALDPKWIESAQKLAKAEDTIEEAQHLLTKDEKLQDSPALVAGYKIIDSILSSIRRERVDLLDRAKVMFDICVTFTDQSIEVRGADASSDSSISETENSSLEEVYGVLEAFSSAEESNSALKETMRRFTSKLFRQVLKPVLDMASTTKPDPVLSLTDTSEEESEDNVKKLEWTFKENIVENNTTFHTGRIRVKGAVLRLTWEKHQSVEKNDSSNNKKKLQKQEIVLENWKQALNFLHRTLEFVYDNVLLQNDILCRQVGSKLFGKPNAMPATLNLEALGLESRMIGGNDNGIVMESLVDSLAKTCIPERLKPDEMPQLQAMAEELRRITLPFVQTLVEMNFVTPTDETIPDGSNGTRLEAFSTNFERKFIDNRRCLILNQARAILLKNDYHNTVVTGVDVQSKREKNEVLREIYKGSKEDVFELHKCSISDTAFKLMALVREAMDESVEHAVARSEEDRDTPMAIFPATLYRAAREALDLFRAIIQATHGKEIATVPRTAAVFHNDCVYFQHQCLWLGLEYKKKLPTAPKEPNDAASLFHDTCTFLDMVPLFRELADRSMKEMLELQAHQLIDIVGKRITIFGKSLRSDEILAEWSEAETALAAGLYHIRHLSENWNMILSHDIFVRSVGYLADTLFTIYLEQVTSASDISESACHFVSALFSKATNTLGGFLGGDKSGSAVWGRFEAIGRFMDMTLLDIQNNLANGAFRDVSGQELKRLITATFDDGPKRQRLLQALSSQQ